jgi:predicted esterase
MSWTPFSHGLRLEPILKGSPAALVVLLSDLDASAASLAPIAARWAMSVPTTAFLALEAIEPFDISGDGAVELEDPAMLEHAARRLAPLLERQLRGRRLDASRVVLVGFGYGGTLALHLALRQGWRCAGVLAFAGKLMRPLPRLLSIDHKIRLIGRLDDDDTGADSLRETVASLCARGIDARGVLLTGSALSAEAARHGGAYLVELVATAQRGDLFHFDEERRRAQRN